MTEEAEAPGPAIEMSNIPAFLRRDKHNQAPFMGDDKSGASK